jgi:hypothetical protein
MKTAVEWYELKIKNIEFWVETKQITWKEYHKEKNKLLNQAKEMEKERIENSFYYGVELTKIRVESIIDEADFEDYYNENFNQ